MAVELRTEVNVNVAAVGEYTHGTNNAAGRRGYAVSLRLVRRGATKRLRCRTVPPI
ncbi:MAG: hypothetical protein WD030_01290 [Pirellulales bacterium]